MKNIILSAPGREDVVKAYKACFEKYYPAHGMELITLDAPTDTGWVRRLIYSISGMNDEFVYITLDDYILNKYVDPEGIGEALEILGKDKNNGAVYVSRVYAPEIHVQGYAQWGAFNDEEPKYKRNLLLPCFMRTEYLRALCAYVLDRMPGPPFDKAWTGAYNFELWGGEFSVKYRIYAPLDQMLWPISFFNLIEQGGLRRDVLEHLRKDVDLPSFDGWKEYKKGYDPYMENWQLTRDKEKI